MKNNSEQIESIVESIIGEPHKVSKQQMEGKIVNEWKKSEKLFLSIISIKSNLNDNFDRGKSILYSYEKEIENDLFEIEYLISSSEDSGLSKLEHYSSLQHNYYKIVNGILECKSIILSNQINKIEDSLQKSDSSLNEIYSKTTDMSDKFDGIGSTMLSTIVSLTVVVTAIAAIDKIPTIFIPIYLVFMVWLGMTFIVFINNLFNKEDFNNKHATTLYIIISIFTVLLLVVTLLYIDSHNIDISKSIQQLTNNSSQISQ